MVVQFSEMMERKVEWDVKHSDIRIKNTTTFGF